MKQFDVLTLFPELFEPFAAAGLLGKAIEAGLVGLTALPLRAQGLGRWQRVDDSPYGGGAGMVLRPEPVFAAVRARQEAHAAQGQKARVVLLSPQGRRFDQALARTWAADPAPLLLVCGRYEGFDERIRQGLADEEVSLGDFVSLGGEAVAMVMIETVARLLTGVLGNPASTEEESFAAGVLEYPQYTRPEEFEGRRVPEVLLSGDHARIAQWRREEALRRTRERRPDLLAQVTKGSELN